ncbi:MAG TPA: cellulase family glycosylhydrolase [Cyclobacteriaceae bacterium]|nr:cellulase family glycosylhydrolase [Cyclobacteriaceae bacterium]
MKKPITLLVVLFMITGSIVSGQGYLRVDGKRIVDEKGNNVLLRGMGLGGWMLQEGYMLGVEKIGQQQNVIKKNIADLIGTQKAEVFYDTWLANHTRKIDIDSMASWGFNSIRLAMHYNLYTLPVEKEPVAGQNTWVEKGFTMTDSLLSWCKANKVYLILDLHAAPGGQGNDLNIADRDPSVPSLWQSEANKEKMIALWKKLAERYVNEPWIAAYDIINEPNYGFTKEDDKNGCNEEKNEPLRQLMVDITKTIREIDKKHIIIIEGNCWGNNYRGVFPLWDNNIVVSFHKYWSFNDEATIKGTLDIREEQNVPIWLGESGENSNLWFRDAIQLIEQRNIGWAWWPLKKLGNNNPLQVKMPAAYQKVLDYWAGKGPRPSPAEAEKGLMEFANNLKLENCIYHKDVVDAMFRQVQTNDTKPFASHATGKVINAVDYDMGRNLYAYADKDTGNYWVSGKPGTGNHGYKYRNDGVDISGDAGNYYVDHFETGEWLKYTIKAAKAGTYNVVLTVTSESATKVGVSVNNGKVSEAVVPDTKGQWQKVVVGKVSLKKGANVVRVSAVEGGFNFQALEVGRK